MDGMFGETGYNRLLGAIKSVCDPNGILSPGRYAPAAPGPEQGDYPANQILALLEGAAISADGVAPPTASISRKV